MLNLFKNKKAQNTAEYAIVIALVVGAAIAMQTYVKRSMNTGVKFAVDKLTNGNAGYEPYYLQSDANTTTKAFKDTEQTSEGGGVTRVYGDGKDKETNRTSTQIINDSTYAD